MDQIFFALICGVPDQARINSIARIEQAVLVIVLVLAAAGVVWFLRRYSRKKDQDRKEQHLRSYILEDPKMRELYLESRKQDKGRKND